MNDAHAIPLPFWYDQPTPTEERPLNHTKLQVFEVELLDHWEQGRIGSIERAIIKAGGQRLGSCTLTCKIRYAAESSLADEIVAAIDSKSAAL